MTLALRQQQQHQVRMAAPLMRTPRTVDVEITARCNLRCRYCYFFDNPAVQYRDLPTEEWLAFFDELGQSGVMEVTLAGGEPFLRKDLPQLVDRIVANRMRFSILSNGSLITERIAAHLAQTGRCNAVQVSVDGSCAEVHDICRGTGSFESAVRGIGVLQRHHVPVTVRVTIHRYNVNDLHETAVFLLEELGLPAFSTNAAGYLGSCRTNAAWLMLGTEERQLAMEILLALQRRYPGRILASAGPMAEGVLWSRMERARAEKAAAFPAGGALTACGCPFSRLAVRADGTYVPCTMLAYMGLGRIRRDPLSEVWQQSEGLNRLRGRHAIPLSEFDFCAECEYLPYCSGNCPALAYAHTGEVDYPAPDACLRSFLRSGGSLGPAWVHSHASYSPMSSRGSGHGTVHQEAG